MLMPALSAPQLICDSGVDQFFEHDWRVLGEDVSHPKKSLGLGVWFMHTELSRPELAIVNKVPEFHPAVAGGLCCHRLVHARA